MTDDVRLPRTSLPVEYDLTIAPDLQTGRFDGTVSITLDVREAASPIVCNAHQLDVELDSARPGRRRAGGRTHTRHRGRTHHRQRSRSSGRAGRAAVPVPRHALRRPRRLLPQHLHRARRHDSHARHHAVRGTPRAPGLPLLRRARLQGRVLDRARRRRRPHRVVERARGRPDTPRRRARAGAVRQDDLDVDVSGRVHRGRARLHPGGRGHHARLGQQFRCASRTCPDGPT